MVISLLDRQDHILFICREGEDVTSIRVFKSNGLVRLRTYLNGVLEELWVRFSELQTMYPYIYQKAITLMGELERKRFL